METAGSPVVVVGAGGFVGSRVVAGLSRAGRTVLAASRGPLPMPDDDGAGQVRAPGAGPGGEEPRTGRIVPVRYDDAAGPGDAVRLACEREGLPLPGGVVASIGGWQLGVRLLDEPDLDAWRATLDSHLTAHLATIRSLAPLLRQSPDPNPAYVVLNGAARAEPMAGSGAINVTGAGLAMLVEVLRLEETSGIAATAAAPVTAATASAATASPATASPATAGGTPGDAPGTMAPVPRTRPIRFHELVLDHAVAGDDRNVTPEREVTPSAVVHALTTILDDPAAAAVVHVS